MTVLVDSSVWIDYFKGDGNTSKLDYLIDENLIAVNDLILTELIPFLKLRNQRRLVNLLNAVYKIKLSIQWKQLMSWQYQCLKSGLNGIGIPDLIIAQNALQNDCMLYSLDHHFELIKEMIGIERFV
ncbi:twitching motility protein PilT [Desulfosarcina widdelii]|uniref:Twitching motility protein PilT n=1 Tax=Desulfosarcina widdelii TaxID=947919 RepID=A0A5K7Z0H4_9BACT|nr:PIN domain-containing protein [Desulfosarcina widdelii]BBO72941.1 twitching motility protein PilT [Desulfosarcina widdelii]